MHCLDKKSILLRHVDLYDELFEGRWYEKKKKKKQGRLYEKKNEKKKWIKIWYKKNEKNEKMKRKKRVLKNDDEK